MPRPKQPPADMTRRLSEHIRQKNREADAAARKQAAKEQARKGKKK